MQYQQIEGHVGSTNPGADRHEAALEILMRGLCNSQADVRYLSTVTPGAAPLGR
jgi:hypothetical protein